MDETIFLGDEEYDCRDSINDEIELSLSESDESEQSSPRPEINKIDSQSRMAAMNMKNHIDKIKDDVAVKLNKVNQLRDELALCDNHVLELRQEEQLTRQLVDANRSDQNIAAVFRLQGQLKRIEIELEGENDLRQRLEGQLNDAEQGHIASQLEEGKLVAEERDLERRAHIHELNAVDSRARRLNNENRLTNNAKLAATNEQRNSMKKEYEKSQQSTATEESAKAAHLKHSKYVKKTIKEKRASKEQLEKQLFDKQQKKEMSFQKLNSEIANIKENLTAIQSKRNSELLLEKEKEMELRKTVAQKGGNPNLEVKIKIKEMKIMKEKEIFEKSIKENQLKIANKILIDEENLKRKINRESLSSQERVKPYKVLKNKPSQLAVTNISMEDNEPYSKEEEGQCGPSVVATEAYGITQDNDILIVKNLSNTITTETKKKEFESGNDNKNKDIEHDMNTPEFEGLWDTTVNYKVPQNNNNMYLKSKSSSKMEQEIMSRVLHQLKENIIQPQVVNKKVFKGNSFQSKPDAIIFENLEVGGKYQQRVVLTNISYCINQCRFDRISENLVDFINLKFTSSGPLSPGMTCDFNVFFEPKLDQDLFGEIYLTSQSERFSIPVSCLTKKCKIDIDRKYVKFETTVVGEKLVQSIKLKNSGAKGTFCTMKNKSHMNDASLTKKSNDLNEKTDERKDEEELFVDQPVTTSIGDLKLWIEPYGELEIMIKWCPTVIGEYIEDFFIDFEDEDNKGIDLRVLGNALDIPVFIEEQTISMDICMTGRLYQDTIIFNSRAAIALKLQFRVPKEMKDYLEILPNSGFIQAGQSFKAQIKLLVRSTIYDENCPYLDKETGILDVPITTSVAGQGRTVDFNLQAVLTTTDLEIHIPETESNILDFGYCTIKETKVKTIHLENKSILPQEFGFTGYPEFVEIQPNFGYGIILPKETLEFQILFSPPKADNFKFQLRCQTLIDRSFTISCCGTGVRPALEVSNQILTFPHTAIDDRSQIDIYIQNNHLSTNIYTHEPPRVGQEAVVPVGPQTFQFIIPNDLPIFIHPRFGSLKPGEKQKISVFFEPKFAEDTIKTETCTILNNALEQNAKQKWEDEIRILELQKEEQLTTQKSNVRKSAKKTNRPPSDKSKNHSLLDDLIRTGPAPFERVKPDDVIKDSDQYLKGKLSLLRKLEFNFEKFNIKCLIGEGAITERSDSIIYNPFNTLYLELHCPSVKPDLIILSNSGRPVIDFGDSIINQKVKRTLSIQNISSEYLQLKSTLLDPNGAFQICNAVRPIAPDEISDIIIAFTAREEGMYQSNWSLFGNQKNKILKIAFKAKSIIPRIEFKDLQNGVFNVGTVLSNEFCEKPLSIINNSSIKVDYKFVLTSQEDINSHISARNRGPLSEFTIVPHKGTIDAGMTQIVTVSFAPDHDSDKFTEEAKFFLFDNVELRKFMLRGTSRSNQMYIDIQSGCKVVGGEYLGESWITEHSKGDDDKVDESVTTTGPLILQGYFADDGLLQEAKCSFIIGCVKTFSAGQKKNGEFTIDNLNILTPMGFNVEPAKGQIEAGTEKVINISWSPPANYRIGSIISVSVVTTLKGDVSKTHSIELRGFAL